MEHIHFDAPEYRADGSFETVAYEFRGDSASSWRVLRNGESVLELGAGYVPVQTICCGVCSTDLARRFLPYPLPQIIGHEVVGLRDGRPVVVEINASHLARGQDVQDCSYCAAGLDTQCPERITLGINVLPGGFAPYFLAPTQAVLEVPKNVSITAAALTEPFAAALQGVDATRPQTGDRVGVLGPRRLGNLLVAALAGFRKEQGVDFEIVALSRHDRLLEFAALMGADKGLNLTKVPPAELAGSFDIVFDTTGTPAGFETALLLARRAVHLKSTNGRDVLGMNHLTDMVVEEQALLPLAPEHLFFTWPAETKQRNNINVFVAPGVSEAAVRLAFEQGRRTGVERVFHRLSFKEATQFLRERKLADSPFPRFDLALVSSLTEADAVIRPIPGEEFSLLRARGALLFSENKDAPVVERGELLRALGERELSVHTSRCGDFRRALGILENQSDIAVALEGMVTQRYQLDEIEKAFVMAGDSERSLKVLVEAPV